MCGIESTMVMLKSLHQAGCIGSIALMAKFQEIPNLPVALVKMAALMFLPKLAVKAALSLSHRPTAPATRQAERGQCWSAMPSPFRR